MPRRSLEAAYGKKLNLDPIFRILMKYKNKRVSKQDVPKEVYTFLKQLHAFAKVVLGSKRENVVKTAFLKLRMTAVGDNEGLALIEMLENHVRL